VQRALAIFGHYDGAADGAFGPLTEGAVKAFQEFTGVDTDGVVGPVTRAALLAPRHDPHKDVGAGSDVAVPGLSSGEDVTYFVGLPPGYLDASGAAASVEAAVKAWEASSGLSFVKTANKADAKISIVWGETEPADQLFKFDGPGGCLAKADAASGRIVLDAGERWLGPDDAEADGAYDVGAVVMHEMGHILGCKCHSADPADVMSPYYLGRNGSVSAADGERVGKLYPKTAEA